jgi:hypothetical protein
MVIPCRDAVALTAPHAKIVNKHGKVGSPPTVDVAGKPRAFQVAGSVGRCSFAVDVKESL